jgi:hypothetical protein
MHLRWSLYNFNLRTRTFSGCRNIYGTFKVTRGKNTDSCPRTINITTAPKSQVVVYSNDVTAFHRRTVHNYWIRFKLN